MARCSYCGRDMSTAIGCSIRKIKVFTANEEIFVHLRVKFGSEQNSTGLKKKSRCPRCMARVGHYHHYGCDVEECPVCGKPIVSCSCESVRIISNYEPDFFC